MKRCSTSLDIKEMQIKTTLRYHFTPTSIVVIKKVITSVDETVEELGPTSTAGEDGKWRSRIAFTE